MFSPFLLWYQHPRQNGGYHCYISACNCLTRVEHYKIKTDMGGSSQTLLNIVRDCSFGIPSQRSLIYGQMTAMTIL